MLMNVLHRCMQMPGGQKMVSDLLDLELQITVMCPVGARHQARVLFKSRKCS